jgi:hypothetical protein
MTVTRSAMSFFASRDVAAYLVATRLPQRDTPHSGPEPAAIADFTMRDCIPWDSRFARISAPPLKRAELHRPGPSLGDGQNPQPMMSFTTVPFTSVSRMSRPA